MKVFSYIVILLALGLIGFNLTKINYNNPFEEGSNIALIGIVAGLCAIVLMLIFRVSKIIEEKTK